MRDSAPRRGAARSGDAYNRRSGAEYKRWAIGFSMRTCVWAWVCAAANRNPLCAWSSSSCAQALVCTHTRTYRGGSTLPQAESNKPTPKASVPWPVVAARGTLVAGHLVQVAAAQALPQLRPQVLGRVLSHHRGSGRTGRSRSGRMLGTRLLDMTPG